MWPWRRPCDFRLLQGGGGRGEIGYRETYRFDDRAARGELHVELGIGGGKGREPRRGHSEVSCAVPDLVDGVLRGAGARGSPRPHRPTPMLRYRLDFDQALCRAVVSDVALTGHSPRQHARRVSVRAPRMPRRATRSSAARGGSRQVCEMEITQQIAELRGVLPHVRPRIGARVRGGIKPLASEKHVLDELQVGVEAQHLVVDEVPAGIRTDHQPRHAQSATVLVDDGRHDMVVETSPVVPGEEEAVLSQAGPSITALTSVVTYRWPTLIKAIGCSLTSPLGTIHETAGNVPSLARRRSLQPAECCRVVHPAAPS